MMLSLESLLEQEFAVASGDLSKALAFQAKYGGRLEHILVNLGALDEQSLPDLYARLLDLNITDLSKIERLLQPQRLSQSLWQQLLEQDWYAVGEDEQGLDIAVVDPFNTYLADLLASEQIPYRLTLLAAESIEHVRRLRGSHDASEQPILGDGEENRLRELANEGPVVALFNAMLNKGIRYKASDLHLEPYAGRIRARYRIDGVLQNTEWVPAKLRAALVARIKILAGLDIAERRLPQDGRVETRLGAVELDIRVSTLPLKEGESVVLRFLRKETIAFELARLGIEPDLQAKLERDISRTSGAILLTGPTGSGKTTTLYTFLNRLNSADRKIITLEDPVEYQLDGVNQVHVNEEIGFSFSTGLRSIVRQDPDVIMVGEIRDVETARIALQSSLTGHLVFSTVHTNDAPSAYTRLLDLGVEEFILNAALVSIVAQRLARKICPQCIGDDPHSAQKIKEFGLRKFAAGFKLKLKTLKRGEGCEHCAHTGYQGRVALLEYLPCDEHIRGLAKDENFLAMARQYMHQQGIRTLFEDGLLKICKGETTLAEVLRVAG